MKLSLASRVLDFVGRRLIGEPNALFGTPPGALDQLYLVPADRTGHETLDPEQVHNAAWLRQRAAVIFLRRNLQWRAGMAVSAAILPLVCAGLLLAGGISASTSGIRKSWQEHEAAAAQAKAQAAEEAQRIASLVDEAKTSCQIQKGIPLTGQALQNQQLKGCDLTTGTLDMDKAKAWATKLVEGNQQ